MTELQASPTGFPPPIAPPVIAPAASVTAPAGLVAASQRTLALARGGDG
ncbi:MAG: hypothetical protein JSU06_16465 [Actinobacteria bacterium]|nr:hypothetical protein [Actinomycetota bacterium]